MPPLKDTAPLHDAIRDVAADLLAAGPGQATQFVSRFRRNHPELLSDFSDFMCDQYLSGEGRRAVKGLTRKAMERVGGGQLDLPLSMASLNIPAAFIVPGDDGESRWVPRDHATMEDGEAYLKILRDNVTACIEALTDFSTFWAEIKPLLFKNPDWLCGDAIRALRADEKKGH